MSIPKRTLAAAAAALAVCVALALALRGTLSRTAAESAASGAATSAGPGADRAARTIAVKERNGATRNLAAPSGRILVVHFWATWCAPCVEEFPGLAATWRKLRDRRDIEFVTVSVDDSWKVVDPWLAKNRVSEIPTLLDPTRSAAKAFGTEKFPETWILGPDGAVLAHVAGPMDWSNPGVVRQLEEFATALPSRT